MNCMIVTPLYNVQPITLLTCNDKFDIAHLGLSSSRLDVVVFGPLGGQPLNS